MKWNVATSGSAGSAMRKNYTEAEYDEVLKRVSNGKAKSPATKPVTRKFVKYGIYRNKLEFSFAQTLVSSDLFQKYAGVIKDWTYESMTLKLSEAAPGKRGDYHRSDFLIWHLDGTIELAQTKGWHKNLSASLKGLRWAAQKNPWFTFTIRRFNNGWQTEEVGRERDPLFGQ